MDGACRIRDLPRRIKELGQTACAITDHGVMYGAIDFYRACKRRRASIRLSGARFMWRPGLDLINSMSLIAESRHLVLLCKDETGYRNLSYMVSQAFVEGFYIKPRIDLDLLRGALPRTNRLVRMPGRGDPQAHPPRQLRRRQGVP